MSKYVIAKYIRLSLDDAHTDSMSIENQRLILDAHIAELGIPGAVVIERVDNGVSGTHFERPGVQDLLELVRAGEVGCILVKDFSRFGRSAIETGYFIERVFPLFGVRFISVTDGYDSNNYVGDTGGLEVSFHFLKHEYYSRDLSQKVKSAKRVRQQRGESVRINCIFGYKLSKKRQMVIDEITAGTVRLIFALAIEGKNMTEIAKRLYDDKCPTPCEHRWRSENPSWIWNKSTIWTILREEQYTGVYIAGRTRVDVIGSGKAIAVPESEWVKIPGHHPAIVDRSLFDAVRAGEPKRRRMTSAAERCKTVSSPLKGLVVCGSCGHAMVLKQAANSRFVCYFTRAASGAECYRLSIAAKELEDSLFGIISAQARTILNIGSLSDLPDIDLKLEEQSEYEKRIERLEDEKRELYEQLVTGEISVGGYRDAKTALDAELARLARTQAAIANEAAKFAEAKATGDERRRIAEIASSADTLTHPLVETLIDHVFVYPGERVEVKWKFADYFK